MTTDEPAKPAEVADFHLVESGAGWLLSINMTPHMVGALRNQATAGNPHQVSGFTVQIEPNLVPGAPFEVDLILTTGPASDTC